MNIVLCSEGARADAGGLGHVAVPEIARALAARGHRVIVEIFGPVIPGAETFIDAEDRSPFQQGLVAHTYPALGRYAFAPRAVSSVLQHVARADFVMLHSLYSFAVLSGYLAARRHGVKYGLWPHGVLAPFQRRIGAQKKAIYDRLAARSILERASVLFYNAEGERAEVAPLHLTAPSVIIPHGLHTEPYQRLPPRGAFRAKWLHGFDGPVLLYLGRLNVKKGLDLLVQAMGIVHAARPDVRLAVVGAGDPPSFGEAVGGWVRTAGLEDVVVMPGLLQGTAKLEALADADIFVLPSSAENFSFAMFEAMAAQLPVVVSETLNFAPPVKRAGAGLVVPREPSRFADAIVELVDAPAARRARGAQGALLAGQYSWKEVGVQMERAVVAVVRDQPLPRDLVLGSSRV